MSNLDTDMALVMGTAHGRRVVASLLALTNVEGVDFTADERRDTFNLGRRSIGVYIADWVKQADYDLYLRMIEEQRHGLSE